jgi:transcription elongation factor GreA
MNKVPMTVHGFDTLKEELRWRQQEERPRIIEAISEARSHGDLSENAEYHAARERQSFIEGRMMELEDKLARAEIIDISNESGSSIKFGARVKLVDEETEEELQYQIVGPDESEIQKGLLSVNSPLGRALIGRVAGDTVEVNTPRGTRYFEIVDVHYPGEITAQ